MSKQGKNIGRCENFYRKVSDNAYTVNYIPKELIRVRDGPPGTFLGGFGQVPKGCYVGMPQGEDGNIIVIGGNGSGKSSGIAKPTLCTWSGAICATDVKGELSKHYVDLSDKLYHHGIITRPPIIFDPTQIDGPSYDPFWLLSKDSPENLYNNIRDIALAIIPTIPDDKEPFWVQSEQDVLTAALFQYFKYGLSFSEALLAIVGQSVFTLCEELAQSEYRQVRNLVIGMTPSEDSKMIASIDRGLRNKLTLFANDPYISHVFRGMSEKAECVTWDDLNDCNIFLRIPADKIEQWGSAINLMYTQLFRYLERRPEKHSEEGVNNVQTLLLMDEFARFGKLEMIASAMATLRSKNVNICLMVQSMAQLDKIYGVYDRRIIMDNCQYQVILQANDADTQKYLSERIGTYINKRRSASENMDKHWSTTGYSMQISETRDYVVQPHELSTLKDVILLTPYGYCRVEKLQPDSSFADYMLYSILERQREAYKSVKSPSLDDPWDDPSVFSCNNLKKNESAIMMTIEERTQNAVERIAESKDQHQFAQRRQSRRRNDIIGKLVTQYLPDLTRSEPGTQDEDEELLLSLEAFLMELSSDQEVMATIKERTLHWQQPGVILGPEDLKCVSGPDNPND